MQHWQQVTHSWPTSLVEIGMFLGDISVFFFAQSHHLEFEVSVLFEGVKDVENEGDHQRFCRKPHNRG